MANRSDFFNAKLPRRFKRMLAMEEANGWIKTNKERNDVKTLFIAAHANHVAYKMKRQSMDSGSSGEE
jgi:hypothetical protein